MHVTQWPGTLAEREQRRAQLIGKALVSVGTENPDMYAKWIALILMRTRLRDRWLWSSVYLKDTTLEESRAQVAGDVLLSVFADGSQSHFSAYWFNAAAQTDDWAEGWLFDEECLRADGWIETTGVVKTKGDVNGKPWRGWHKKNPVGEPSRAPGGGSQGK